MKARDAGLLRMMSDLLVSRGEMLFLMKIGVAVGLISCAIIFFALLKK